MSYQWPARQLTKTDVVACLKAAHEMDPNVNVGSVRSHFANLGSSTPEHYRTLWEGLRTLSIQRTADKLMKLGDLKVAFPPERILLYDGAININFPMIHLQQPNLSMRLTSFADTLTDDVVPLGNQPRYLWSSTNFRSSCCVTCGKVNNVGWALHPDDKIGETPVISQGWMRLYNQPGSHPVREALQQRLLQTANGPGNAFANSAYHIAALCKNCILSCEECGAKAELEITDANLPPMIREKRCVGCIGLTLTSIVAPKPSRDELRAFHKTLTVR